jgi:hypothetical protein
MSISRNRVDKFGFVVVGVVNAVAAVFGGDHTFWSRVDV